MSKILPITQRISWTSLLIAVIILSISANTIRAETLLRFKHTPGTKSTYESVQATSTNIVMDGKTMTSKIKNQMTFSQEVKAVDKDGVATVVIMIDSVKMSMTMPQGQEMQYDSTVEKELDGMEKMIAQQFSQILNKPFEVKIDSMGNVSEVKTPEGLANNPGMAGMFGDDSMKQMFGNISFPKEAVEAGKTWTVDSEVQGVPGLGAGAVKQTFKYLGPEKNKPNLEKIQTTIEMKLKLAEDTPAKMKLKDQESKGEMLFDNRAGRLQESTVTSKMEFEMDMMGKPLTNSVETTVKIKLIPNNGAK